MCVAEATTRCSQQPAMPTAKPFSGVCSLQNSVCQKHGFVSACATTLPYLPMLSQIFGLKFVRQREIEVIIYMNGTDEKIRFALYTNRSVMSLVDKYYEDDNCKSKSEFIERAIQFYSGYLASNQNSQYLSTILTSTLKSIIKESDNRMGRLIFKLAVELAITMNLIAARQDVDKEVLSALRGECIKEVKKINGSISFDDAYDWQTGQ